MANLARSRVADEFAADLLPVLYELVRRQGVTGLSEQAAWLNANGHRTRPGNPWSASSLKQFYARVKARGIRPRPGKRYVITDDDLPG